jgi:hypothetical protein
MQRQKTWPGLSECAGANPETHLVGAARGAGKSSARDWVSLIPLYHFHSVAGALAYTENPVGVASKLAADRVGIPYVTGETDDAVA